MSDLTPYIGNSEAFPVLRNWDFFNHAGVAPICRAAADAMRRFAAEAEAGAYLGTTWYADLEKLRESAISLRDKKRKAGRAGAESRWRPHVVGGERGGS